MAKHENLTTLFTAIADSIRNKTGGTDAIIADDFPEAIDGIQAGVDKIQRYIELNDGSATHLFYCFKGQSIDEFLDGVDATIKDASYMFAGCNYITSVPFFDTSKTTNMDNMFESCLNLTSVPLFPVIGLQNANNMFKGCSKLTTIPQFVTSGNFRQMSGMFQDCKSLTTVPLFETKNVVTFNRTFSGCSNLTEVPLFNTSSVTDIGSIFLKCSKLTSLPLFNTKKCTSFYAICSDCSSLTTVPMLDARNVTTFSTAFNNCIALTECLLCNIKANIQVGNGTSWGHLLTLESLLHLCKECRKTTSSLTLTVGTANLEKLANVYVKLIDVTDDMRAEDDLIDEKYPFVVCESTDEDAMTIQDYMALKKWTLK